METTRLAENRHGAASRTRPENPARARRERVGAGELAGVAGWLWAQSPNRLAERVGGREQGVISDWV